MQEQFDCEFQNESHKSDCREILELPQDLDSSFQVDKGHDILMVHSLQEAPV